MGIFKSLFSSKDTNTSSKMSFQQAADIAGSFGDVLQSYSPGTISDTSKLPFSKPIIKQALLTLLKENTDPQMLEHLKSSYWLLADWQDGIGDNNIGLDPTNMDLSDPIALANQIASQGDAMKKWSAVAESERQQLRGELQELGYL